jgi:hypothetical protein
MKSWENLFRCFFTGFRMFFFNDLGVVFDDGGQTMRCQQSLPKVVCFDAVWIGGISGAVVPSLITGEKP